MPRRVLIIFVAIAILFAGIFYIRINSLQQTGTENRTELEEEAYSKPIPENQIPIVEIVNQSFSKKHLNITKNWRVRFVNKDNVTYTLIIEELGIEEEIYPKDTAEPTFFKKGNITFWIKELGINATNGTVHVG
jgi:hypothetical protein